MGKRNISLFLIILSFFLVLGCTSKEKRVSEFISDGKQYLQKKEYENAILEFKNALQLDPKNPRAMFFLGKAYLGLKNYPKAYGAFRRTLELDNEYDKARIELSSLLVLAKQPDKALEYLNSIKEKKKFEPRISIIKAQALILKEKYNDAVDILAKIKDFQKNKKTQMLLAFCYKKLGSFKNMQHCIQRWREIDPKDPGSYIFMARYWLGKKDRRKAIFELNEMTLKNPSNNLKLFKALALENLGLIEDAKKTFDSLPQEPNFLREKAGFYLRQNNLKKAEEILKELIKKDPQDIKATILLARVFLKKREVDLAYDLLDKGIKNAKNRSAKEMLFVEKAKILLFEGKIDEAKDLLEKVLKENQASFEAHFLLGKILFFEGNYTDAEVHLSQVAVAKPLNTEVQILLAKCQFMNKKTSMAEETLKNALLKMPKNRVLRLELVRFYLIKKQPQEALEVLEKGLLLDPKDVNFLKVRGEINVLLKKYPEAEKDFYKIIKLRSDDAGGYIEMGKLFLEKKDYKNALKWFKEAYSKKYGIPTSLTLIVETYLRKKDIDSAIAFCKKEINLRPNYPVPYYLLGRLYILKKDFNFAEKMFLKAKNLSPLWQEPYKGLASIYLFQGKIDEAIKRLEESFNQRRTVSTGIMLATLYGHKKEYKKAENIYRNLLKLRPNSPAILNNIAYVYSEHYQHNKEKLNRARKIIAKVLSRYPDNPDFLDTAAWIEYRLNNLDTAKSYIQEALIKSKVSKGIICLHAAEILYQLGEKEKAIKYLNIALGSLDPKIRNRAVKLKNKFDRSR